MRIRDRLSLAEARRIALAAQGFAEPRPAGRPGRRLLLGTLARLGLVQIDSVNVLTRSHYLPLFSRRGAYATALLDEAAWGGRRRRQLFEYWGHEASLLPVAAYPLFGWRMAEAARLVGISREKAAFVRERGDFIEAVLGEVAARGPIGAGDLSQPGARNGPWWGWSPGKTALEWLFWTGRVTTATRRGFERLYDLPGRVLPPAILAAPAPPAAAAQRALLRIAARALGIATEPDLRDYFRLTPGAARTGIAALVEDGALVPVAVEGWRHPAYLDRAARLPRRIAARALLSPFDSLIWERARTERLFGFRYRLEIYTPAPLRKHGYYVLPFLLGDRLVARVDLKADRARGVLLVHAAHPEPDAAPAAVAPALEAALGEMAAWLGLDGLAVRGGGGVAEALRRSA